MRAGKYTLDAVTGEPLRCEDIRAWADFIGRPDMRHLARDTKGAITVSTVFLGLDYGDGEGPPVLWETLIVNGPADRYVERYASRADALAGHARAVALAFNEAPR